MEEDRRTGGWSPSGRLPEAASSWIWPALGSFGRRAQTGATSSFLKNAGTSPIAGSCKPTSSQSIQNQSSGGILLGRPDLSLEGGLAENDRNEGRLRVEKISNIPFAEVYPVKEEIPRRTGAGKRRFRIRTPPSFVIRPRKWAAAASWPPMGPGRAIAEAEATGGSGVSENGQSLARIPADFRLPSEDMIPILASPGAAFIASRRALSAGRSWDFFESIAGQVGCLRLEKHLAERRGMSLPR